MALTAGPLQHPPRRKVHCQATGLAKGGGTSTLGLSQLSLLYRADYAPGAALRSAPPSPTAIIYQAGESLGNDPRVDTSLVFIQGKKNEMEVSLLSPCWEGSHGSSALTNLPLPSLKGPLPKTKGKGKQRFLQGPNGSLEDSGPAVSPPQLLPPLLCILPGAGGGRPEDRAPSPQGGGCGSRRPAGQQAHCPRGLARLRALGYVVMKQ